MQNARQGILYLATFIGAWLLISFGGAMFDSANAALWSDSLMWSLLAFMIISPALVFLSTPAAETSQAARGKDFVDNHSEEDRRLWPEPEDQNKDQLWPDSEQGTDQNRSVRARV